MKTRIFLVLLSGLSLLVLALLACFFMAQQTNLGLLAAQRLLETEATQAENAFGLPRQKSNAALACFVGESALSADIKALSQVGEPPPGGEKALERFKTKTDGLRQTLAERLKLTRKKCGDLSAVTLVDQSGLVLATDSTLFKTGTQIQILSDNPEPKPESKPVDSSQSAPDAKAQNNNSISVSKNTTNTQTKDPTTPPVFRLTALSGAVQSTTLTGPNSITFLAAAALVNSDEIVGAVILETTVKSLPKSVPTTTFVIFDNAVLLGQAPQGFVSDIDQNNSKPFLSVAQNAYALLPFVGPVPFAALFLDQHQIGVWAQRFSVSELPKIIGFVTLDVSPSAADLARRQLFVLALAFLVWLIHLLIVTLCGRSLRLGVTKVADFLGRINQGIGEERQLSERQVPTELVRLVRLLNARVAAPNATLTKAVRAPSLDDVLGAQAVGQNDLENELEFEGITNSGSLTSSINSPFTAEDGKLKEDPISDDGYESLTALVPSAETLAAKSSVADSPPTNLPPVAEALSAIENLTANNLSASEGAPNKNPKPPPPPKESVTSVPNLAGNTNLVASSMPDELATPNTARPLPNRRADPIAAVAALASEDSSAVAELLRKNLVSPAPQSSTKPASPPLESAPGATQVSQASQAAKASNENYQTLFKEFLSTRQRCGESGADLTYDKFLGKLERSREAVMAKHNCSNVTFQVYVKNGKAALRAVPTK